MVASWDPEALRLSEDGVRFSDGRVGSVVQRLRGCCIRTARRDPCFARDVASRRVTWKPRQRPGPATPQPSEEPRAAVRSVLGTWQRPGCLPFHGLPRGAVEEPGGFVSPVQGTRMTVTDVQLSIRTNQEVRRPSMDLSCAPPTRPVPVSLMPSFALARMRCPALPNPPARRRSGPTGRVLPPMPTRLAVSGWARLPVAPPPPS